jgi:hypothetical protein
MSLGGFQRIFIFLGPPLFSYNLEVFFWGRLKGLFWSFVFNAIVIFWHFETLVMKENLVFAQGVHVMLC